MGTVACIRQTLGSCTVVPKNMMEGHQPTLLGHPYKRGVSSPMTTSPKLRAQKAAIWARYKCRLYGLPEGDADWTVFFHLHVQPCAYCGADPARSVDHVMPLKRGGLNTESNLVPSCEFCNDSKGNRTPEEWAAAKEPYQCVGCDALISPRPGKPRNFYCASCWPEARRLSLIKARRNSPVGKLGYNDPKQHTPKGS